MGTEVKVFWHRSTNVKSEWNRNVVHKNRRSGNAKRCILLLGFARKTLRKPLPTK